MFSLIFSFSYIMFPSMTPTTLYCICFDLWCHRIITKKKRICRAAAWPLCVKQIVPFLRSITVIYSAGGFGAPPVNKLKICTKLDPKTTKMKKAMRVGLTRGPSSSRSATLPGSTFPRLVMFLSNLLFRLRIFLGRGCFWRMERLMIKQTR